MNILMIIPARLPLPAVKGGAVETLVDMLTAYNEIHKEHKICCVSILDEQAQEASRKYQYTQFFYIPMGRLFAKISKNHWLPYRWLAVCFAKKAARVIGKRVDEFDCIVLQNELVMGAFLKKRTKGNYIFHAHNTYEISKREGAFLSSCKKIIGISDFLVQDIVKQTDLRNVCTVYNGIDTEFFCRKGHEEEATRLRASYGIGKDQMVIVYSGRLVPEKGIEELLEAFLMLPEDMDVVLVILGATFFKDSKETSFTKRIKNLAVQREDKIIFCGYIEHAKIPDYYAMADVGCVPSIADESFGLSLVEQMSMELPVIATDSGAIPEIVNDTCGYVLKRNDELSKEIAGAITELYCNEELRGQMGECGRNLVCEKFIKERYCRDWFRVVCEENK